MRRRFVQISIFAPRAAAQTRAWMASDVYQISRLLRTYDWLTYLHINKAVLAAAERKAGKACQELSHTFHFVLLFSDRSTHFSCYPSGTSSYNEVAPSPGRQARTFQTTSGADASKAANIPTSPQSIRVAGRAAVKRLSATLKRSFTSTSIHSHTVNCSPLSRYNSLEEALVLPSMMPVQ